MSWNEKMYCKVFIDLTPLLSNETIETQNVITQSSLTVSIGAPTFGGGSSFETLDFSLPSYSESTGGASDGAVKKNEPPSFKADFPELKLPSEEKKADDGKAEADAKKEAEDKAAAKKAAEEEKAAKAKVCIYACTMTLFFSTRIHHFTSIIGC